MALSTWRRLRLLVLGTSAAAALSSFACEDHPELATEPVPVWEPKNDVEVDCASMCEETIANGCEMGNSVKRCAENCAESVELTGPCADVTQDYVRCLGDVGLQSCYDVPPACDDAWLTWSMCSATGNGCGPVRCSSPEVGCACRSFCSDVIVEESCVEGADGFDCVCTVDEEVVSTCPGQATSCAFFIGCCDSAVDALQRAP